MPTRTVIPAVIPRSREHLLEMLALVPEAPAFQIDLVDGAYAGVASWPYEADGHDLASGIRDLGRRIEFDLMVHEHRTVLRDLADIATERIVFHMRGHDDLGLALAEIPSHVAAGIALRVDDDPALIAPYVDKIRFVQCMGIATIGVQGQQFDDRVLAQIRAVKELYPQLEVSVDGGVSTFTIPLLKEAGATRFIAGSAIFGTADPQLAYRALVRMANA